MILWDTPKEHFVTLSAVEVSLQSYASTALSMTIVVTCSSDD